jgi:hypothetical protein
MALGTHRVYLRFRRTVSGSWYCEFLPDGAAAPPPKVLNFTDPTKLETLAERGGGLPDSEAKQMLEHAIQSGRGGLFLQLTHDQLRKLR